MNQAPFQIILCDDETSVTDELQAAIDWEEMGIHICGSAGNGTEALTLLLEQAPDIAVIDINMPGMNGIELLRKARLAGIDTDFIILSGHNDFQYAQEAIRQGVRAYLLKPLNIGELQNELFRILQTRSEAKGEAHGQTVRYRQQVVNSFFHNLLDGKILDSSLIRVTLSNSHIHLSDSDTYVVVLTLPQGSFPDDTAKARILHTLDAAFSQKKHYFFLYNDNQLVGLFNSDSETSFLVAEKILETLSSQGLSSSIIGIGDSVPSLMNAQYSYTRALTSTSYRLYAPGSRIFSYNMICTTPPTFRLEDMDYLSLVQYIVKKDLSGIQTYCREFMEKVLYVPMPAPNYVYSTCYALFHMIEQEFASYSHEEIHPFVSPGKLYQFHSLNEISEWLVESFTQLSEFINAVYGYADRDRKGEGQTPSSDLPADDPIILTAQEYIRSHITDNLRIEDIAREVNLSASYFAIYYKNKTQMNLRDYILQEKMKYARKALLQPGISVTEVAYQLGYGDYRSFSRAFKGLHDMTPSDFQQKHAR